MKLVIILVSIATSGLVLWFCKSPRYTTDNLPEAQIRWGNGGGFTGKESQYILLENGQIFAGGTAAKALDGTRRAKAKKLFKTAETIGLKSLEFQHPGNTYKYIEVMEGGKSRRIVWGDSQYPVSAEVQEFFQKLSELVAQPKE